MSVEKYRIQKESSHFTTFQNKVLQGLKNYLEALGLYCYLASLPPSWEFNKEHLMKETNQGRDKLNKNLSILEKCNLIAIMQGRKENGQFGYWDMLVKDGTEFIPIDQPFTEKPYTEKPLTENQSLENNDYKVNNINNIKDIKQRERESSLSEEDFKTPQIIKLCREKQLLFSLEYKKFSNYYQNREKTLGMFENWLIRAKSETKSASHSEGNTINDYVYRFMKDMKCTEEEARQYYRNRGHSA